MKSLLLGLLIAGTAPVASSEIAPSQFSSSLSSNLASLDSNLCHLSSSKNSCQTSILPSKIAANSFQLNLGLGGNSELWLQPIANLLLPGWTLEKCQYNSSLIKSNNSVCLSPWQKLLPDRNLGQNSLIASSLIGRERALLKETKPSKSKSCKSPQFPTLSRSSLIVSPPTDKLLPCSEYNDCLDNSQLANPAPKTERIASPFGWRRRPYSGQVQFHEGIDYGAPLGSPVVAASNGIVTKVVSGCADFGNLFCGNQFGNWIQIDHGNGIIATYGHLLNKSIQVKEGMKVWRNQEIARVGSSGWSTGAHLDFRIKVNGEYENPADRVDVIENLQKSDNQIVENRSRSASVPPRSL